jgi:hypothetical protein
MSEKISVNHTTNIGGGVKIKKRPRVDTEVIILDPSFQEEVVCISSSVDRQFGSTKQVFENGLVNIEGVGAGQYFSSGLNNHNVEESQRKSEASVNPINSDGVRVDGDEGTKIITSVSTRGLFLILTPPPIFEVWFTDIISDIGLFFFVSLAK